jgi:hypothetical protein
MGGENHENPATAAAIAGFAEGTAASTYHPQKCWLFNPNTKIDFT